MGKSTIQNEEYEQYCFFCGSPDTNGEHHFIFGRGLRNFAEEDGLKASVCDRCHTMGKTLERVHDNPMAEKLSKMFGQAIYERNECAKGVSINDAREKFRRRYGRSYW